MNFTRKASITVTGDISAAEVVAAVSKLDGFQAAILNAAQTGAEAGKSAAGLILATRSIDLADDGSATVELVYESADTSETPAAVGPDAPADQPSEQPAISQLPSGIMIPSATA